MFVFKHINTIGKMDFISLEYISFYQINDISHQRGYIFVLIDYNIREILSGNCCMKSSSWHGN